MLSRTHFSHLVLQILPHAHVLLTLHPVQQSRCLLPYFLLLLRSVVFLLLLELLSEAEFALAVHLNIHSMLVLLLLEIVDVDVDRCHAVGLLSTAKSSRIVAKILLPVVVLICFEGRIPLFSFVVIEYF